MNVQATFRMRVHPTALVAADVVLAPDVVIGPYCIVESGVALGATTVLHAHVVIGAGTQLGAANEVYPFCVLGLAPQTRRKTESIGLTIGSRNTFREHVTVHAGTEERTRVGDDNLLMVGSHVAHDVVLGNHITLANGVQLAGHVVVADHATFGGLSGVAQRLRIGESVFVAAGSMVERDVPDYVIVQGDRARVRAVNKVGLRRRGFSDAQIDTIERNVRSKMFAVEE
jgi:UDP-N-acetylglucosamine acyltransferase